MRAPRGARHSADSGRLPESAIPGRAGAHPGLITPGVWIDTKAPDSH